MNQSRLSILSLLLTAILSVAALPAHAQWYILKHTASGLYVQFPASSSDNPTLSAEGSPLRFVSSSEGALVQNQDGDYLSANSNGWSINSTSDASSAMSVLVSPLSDGTITLRYKNGTGFGTDATTEGSKLYYNKSRRTDNSYFTLEEATVSDAAAESATVQTFDSAWIDQGEIILKTAGDRHLWSTEPLSGTTINFQSENAWLICDHVRPADFISNYLSSVTVSGETAVVNSNIRVATYRDGCVVIPHSDRYQALLTWHDADFSGESYSYAVGTTTDLGTHANEISSFKLKRGYMATIATNSDGSGYSRVYVADHGDIEVSQLPTASDNRISYISVRRWNYNNKKGWGSTGGNSGEVNTVHADWLYSWSAGYSSGYNYEYVPHKSHVYWPSWSTINGKSGSNHVLGYNEPEHSEQHSDDCGTTISAWDAFKHSSEFLESGMRIGSPSPTDDSWLSDYIDYCDGYARRCDFVCFHAYWTGDASSWKTSLESIHSATGRPIWLTEMEYGASWLDPGYSDVSSAESKYRSIFNLLETLDYVEVYIPYNTDLWYNRMIYEEGGLTPAGKQFRDWDSDFAYHADQQFTPLWWQPSASDVSLKSSISDDGATLILEATNENLDYTVTQYIERLNLETGEWEVILTDDNRPSFDNETNSYELSIADLDIDLVLDQFRLRVVLNTGTELTSDAVNGSLLQNGSIVTTSSTSVPNWTCLKSAQNGYTKSTGDTYLEVWNSTAEGMQFDYYQDVADLPAGYYSLSAQCFNSSNGEEGAWVNGAVELYAATSSIRYSEPVTEDCTIEDSLMLTIPYIYVTSGDTLRVGIRNRGAMTARWAGADNFQLTFLGKTTTAMNSEAITWTREQLSNDIDAIQLQGTYDQVSKAVNATGTSSAAYQRAAIAMAVLSQEKHGEMLADSSLFDFSNLIVNADCYRGDDFGWETSNVSFDEANAWDGTTSGNSYFNYWSSSTWPSQMEQTILDLPAGDYKLTCLARASTAATLTLSALADDETIASTTIAGTGETSADGSLYVKGWADADTLSFSLSQGEALTIQLQCTASGSAWWSADRFRLYCVAPTTAVGISGVEAEEKAETDDRVYTLSGAKATDRQHGILVKKGKKLIINN